MPYVVVDNFSGGLDSRRHVLNSKTGTLAVLKNAHITRGGEIEKRKAFVEYADVSLEALGIQTFGLEATADGIYVFGDVPAPASLPPGVIYQRLLHPDLPLTPEGGAMTKVVHSTVYGGKTFVIAEYDGPNRRMAFYDGVPIKDWYEGYVRHFSKNFFTPGEMYSDDIIVSLASYFPVGNYTAAVNSDSGPSGSWPVLDVTGPAGKPFTLNANIDGNFDGGNLPDAPAAPAAKTSTFQTHKEAIPETLSKGSFSITGGSTTAANAARGGRYIDAAGLPGIRSIRIGASSATANNGLDLIGWGGATGLKYNTYAVTDPYGSDAGALLWNIRKAINDNTSAGLAHGYSARWASYGGWSGPDPAAVWIDAPSALGSGANGLLVQIEFDSNPHNISGISELVDPATIAVSPYDNQRHIATFGVLANGSFNRINSVKVDGVEVLGSPVSWDTSHGATASAVATQINSYTSATEYTASVTDGSKVVLTGVAGTGKTPNGRVISVETEGTIVVSGITSFSGGVNSIAAVPQISRFWFDVDMVGNCRAIDGLKYGLTIIDPDNPSVPIIVGASRVAGKNPYFSITYKAKEYVGVGSTLYFSAINDATKWDIYDTGSGFIDMSNNFGGREDLTGAGIYQDRLAVFSRRNVQLWAMDADPAQNAQVQILANTGCLAPDSVVSVGAIDLLYLADNGIRSLRARESTDTAFSSDIGSAIDSIVIEHMQELDNFYPSFDEINKYFAKGLIEPIDGRYWLSLGNKIYVLSYFPGSNISAWSIYENSEWAEWDGIKEMITREDRVYVRTLSGKIYTYGAEATFDGSGNVYFQTINVYDDCEVVVELPYLDGNKPATYKEAKGIDVTCEGEWKVYLGFDHTNPTARDLVATVNQSTFALGKIPATGAGTHFGPRFVHQAEGPALLANFIVHFDEMHSKHDAG